MKSKKMILSLSIIFTCLLCVMILITTFKIIEQIKYKNKPETHAVEPITGSGTEADPYLVYTAGGYKNLMRWKSTTGYNPTYVILMEDISLEIRSKEELPNWIDASLPGSGNQTISEMFPGGLIFDGNYKQINFKCALDLDGNGHIYSIAPIPAVCGPSTIKNLKVEGYIVANSKKQLSTPPNLSGLIGIAQGINADGLRYPQITINNCYVNVNITSNKYNVGGSGGLVGIAVDNEDAFSKGSISVINTVCCGSVGEGESGKFYSWGDITSYYGNDDFKDYKISVVSSGCYIGSNYAEDQTTTAYSSLLSGPPNNDNKFVKGEWQGAVYSSYQYTAAPNLFWLKNRDNISCYSFEYTVVDNSNNKLTSGHFNKLAAKVIDGNPSADHSWEYDEGSGLLTFNNFGIEENSANIISYVNGYEYKGGSISFNGSQATLTLRFSFTSCTLKFASATGTSKDGNASYEVAQNAQIIISLSSAFSKSGAYKVCKFTFKPLDSTTNVTVTYTLTDTCKYINKATIDGTATTSSTYTAAAGEITFSVYLLSKTYNTYFQ